MNSNAKLTMFVVALTMITLACTTGVNTEETPATLAPILPTNPPLPTSTPVPIEPGMLTGKEILLFDDFSDPASGWDRFENEDGQTNYSDGAYKILVNEETHYFWANPSQEFGDQIIDVQATVISTTPDNMYGVICRHQDVDNWYALVISSDGYAAIRKKIQGGDLEYIVDWKEIPAINLGNSSNDLHVECIGSRLALFVNGTFAIETLDADIRSGDAGLIAGAFEASNVEVQFDNFQVAAP